jgi:hypothetical protein
MSNRTRMTADEFDVVAARVGANFVPRVGSNIDGVLSQCCSAPCRIETNGYAVNHYACTKCGVPFDVKATHGHHTRKASDAPQANVAAGKAILEAVTGKKWKVGKLKGPSESQSQQALIKWWAHACAGFGCDERLLMAFPLQGVRTARNGARMKAEGMRRGLPDLLLAVPVRIDCETWTHGLWIELKSAKGSVNPHQSAMHDLLRSRGYRVSVCRSTQDAIDTITTYLTAYPWPPSP